MKIELTAKDLTKRVTWFDWALRTLRTPGDVIVVKTGARALTLGSWAFPEFGWIGLAPGVHLEIERGAELVLDSGANRTTNGLLRPDRDLNLLWIGEGASISGGGTLNGNWKDFPGWACGGVRAHGWFAIENVRIIGLSGNRAGQESFAISATGATGGSVVRKVVVNDCKTDSREDYVSGIYVGGTEDNGKESLVEDCVVRLGEFGQFAYSSSFLTRFRRCYGEAMRFWYTDTGPGIAVIEKAEGAASYSALGSVATSVEERSITVADSRIRQLGAAGRVVEWWNKGGENRGGITVLRSEFEGFKWRAAVSAGTGSLTFVDSKVQASDGDVLDTGSITPQAVEFAK